MKDTISKFLEISILPNEILIEIENAIKLEKEKFHNYNGSQKGELNNFFGKKHTEISKAKMKEIAEIINELEMRVMAEMDEAIFEGDFVRTEQLRKLYIAILAAEYEDEVVSDTTEETLDLEYLDELFDGR